jgi:hypothetical protein
MPREKSRRNKIRALAEKARECAHRLLEECYEEELLRGAREAKAAPGAMADEMTRGAVLSILRCHVTNKPADDSDISIIKKALNEPIDVITQVSGSDPDAVAARHMLMPRVSVNRSIAEMLVEYMGLWGDQRVITKGWDPPMFFCKKCGKVAIRVRKDQCFCSKQCLWDFWNVQKMKGYYKNKAKESRKIKAQQKEDRRRRLKKIVGKFVGK